MQRATSILLSAATTFAAPAFARSGVDVYLDADTPNTGSLLAVQPLTTPFGDISFHGDLSLHADPDTVLAGGSGAAFDIDIDGAALTFETDGVALAFL